MVDSLQWKKILDIINGGHTFILTSHINPDGDALGSEIALAEFLKSKGKKVYIINNTPTQENYAFLDPEQKIIVFDPERHSDLIRSADAFLIVDISDWERLRELGQLMQQSSSPKICIDHHHKDQKFADIDIIHEQASSTGELIYEFLNYAKCKIDGVIARAIYTCILTDTGSFRFSNTTALTHRIATNLIESGVNSRAIYQEVYEQNSPNKIALMGEAINDFHYECNGKLVWFVLSRAMFKKTNCQQWDTEGFPELPRTIKGVEVSLMFTELKESKVKISLRSKGKIVISNVAMTLGGGGHNFAAGALIQKPLKEAIPFVLKEVKKVVSE